jgi:hypothetical protein
MFDKFFKQATSSVDEPHGRTPYPYQEVFAEGGVLPDLLNVLSAACRMKPGPLT